MSAVETVGSVCTKDENTEEYICACVQCEKEGK